MEWVWSVCFETSEWRRDGLDCVMMKGMKRRRVEMGRIYFRKSRKVKRGEKREGVVMRVEG